MPSAIALSTHFWNVDTGAASNITPHHYWLSYYHSHCISIQLADNDSCDKHTVYSADIGTCTFTPFIDALHNNHFSILMLTECKGFTAKISQGSIHFRRAGQTLLSAFITSGNVAYLAGTMQSP